MRLEELYKGLGVKNGARSSGDAGDGCDVGGGKKESNEKQVKREAGEVRTASRERRNYPMDYSERLGTTTVEGFKAFRAGLKGTAVR